MLCAQIVRHLTIRGSIRPNPPKLGDLDGAGAKMLVVDYEDGIAEIAAFMPTPEGHFVENVTNADVAFDLYQYLAEAQPFNLGLTGRAQPGTNGIDLVEATI